MLEVDLIKRRRDFSVEVTFTLPSGAKLGLFGGSGEGKSTVLSCLAGLEVPDAGRLTFNGQMLFPPPLPLAHRGIGYLTQEDHLFPHLTVCENVLFSLSHRTRAREQLWIGELRERFGLASFWHAPVHHLSGGQARRVALARMIARKPQLVLLDEPFSGLDRHIVCELIQVLSEWQQMLGFTLVVVDHQANIVKQLCPRVLVIEQGRVVQDGSWGQLTREPSTPLLASLLAPG